MYKDIKKISITNSKAQQYAIGRHATLAKLELWYHIAELVFQFKIKTTPPNLNCSCE